MKFFVFLWLISMGCQDARENIKENPISPLDSAIAIAKEVEATIPGDSGLVLYHRALEMAKEQNNFGKQIYLHDKVAENYSYYDQPEVCKAHIDTALQIAEIHDTHYEYIGMCYSTLAKYYTDKGDHKKGLELFKKTLEYRLANLGEDHEDISNSYFVLGYYYLVTRKEYDKAIFYNEKALEMRMATYGKESGEAGEVYGNLADAYSQLGDFHKALTYQQKAVEISEKHSPKDGLNLLSSYMSIAQLNNNLGDKDEALNWLKKVRSAENNDENENIKISNEMIIADYILTTDPDSSKILYQSSLKKLEDKYGPRHVYTYNAHLYLGQYFSYANEFDSALFHINIADSIFKVTIGENSIRYASFLPNKINLFFKFNKYNTAILSATKALEILKSHSIQKEITTNRSGGYPERIDVANNLYFRGRAYLAKGKSNAIEKALQDFEDAIEIFEKIKKKYTTDNSRALLSKYTQIVYNDAIEACIRLAELKSNTDYHKKAFVIAEKARAFNLLNDIQESKAKTFAGIPDSIIVQEEKLKSDIVFYKDLVYRYSQYLDPENPQVVEAKASLLDLRRQFDKLINQIESEYPKYYRLKNSDISTNLSTVQENLSDESALLEFYVGKNDLTIFLITNNQFEVFTEENASEKLRDDVSSYYSAINKYEKEEIARYSQSLYDDLLSKVLGQIQEEIREIKIVPHRELNFLPFDCLRDHQGRYTLEKFNISFYYSSYFIGKKNEPTRNSELIVYAPVYDDPAENTVSPLPASDQEAENIRQLFGNESVNVVRRRDATKEHFKEKSSQYDYIHLAAHTNLDKKAIEHSYINFWGGEENQLTLAETYNLSISPELLTLSSCETGIGQLQGGEGMLSFTRGFSYSGAKNIVCSLWKVNDYYTSSTMTEMYTNIKNGNEYGEALRLAKLALIKKNPDLSPKDWAGFILIQNE